MSAGRRLWWLSRVPLLVAGRRLRGQPGRAALVVLGIAASIAMLVGVLGGSVSARDRAVQQAVAALPAAERSFRVDTFSVPLGKGSAGADRDIRAALAEITPVPPLRGEFLRALRFGNSLVRLAGVDRPGEVLRLQAGRLPTSCTQRRCEVLQIGPGSETTWTAPGLRFVRVGVAAPSSETPFGASLERATTGQERSAPVLVTSGAAALDRLSALAGISRTYSWVVPLDAARLHLWQISTILRQESRAQARLLRASDAYVLSGPDDALLDARSRGHVAAGRMVLLGGELCTLLLVFALVSAIGLRRGVSNEQRRLRQRGARPFQLWLAVVAEIGGLTLLGAALGIVLGSIAVASATSGAVLSHSLPTGLGLAAVSLGWLAASAALVAVAQAGNGDGRSVVARMLDVAAVGAVVTVVVNVARGDLSAAETGSSGNATLLLLLPGLVSFAASVLAIRVFGPLMRAIERVARSGPLAGRLAVLGLARTPARSGITATFVLISLGLALFAVSYRSTLQQSARDEAGFAVPLDFTLSEGAQLTRPLEVAPLARYRQLANGTEAYPVLRQSAGVAGSGTSVLSPTVVGIPAPAVEQLRWRSDYAAESRAELARRLGADGPARLRGVAIPPGTHSVSTDVSISGVPVALALDLATPAGVTSVPLGQRGPGRWHVTARLPRTATLIYGLEVTVATNTQLGLTHRAAEGELNSVPRGALELGPLTAGSRRLTDWQGWLARGNARLDAGRPVRFSYSFPAGGAVRLRPKQVTDSRLLHVLASPAIARAAGPGGSLTLNFEGVEIPAQIVAVASRFPAAEDEDQGFVVADESRLATALDADLPGTGTPGDLWLSVPHRQLDTVATKLRPPPFSTLELRSRSEIEQGLAHDPLARGIVTMLELAAAVALGLAVVGFGVALVSELRDEQGELFDLEAQGVSPATLRGQFRLRASAILVFGALTGVALGFVLSRLTVGFVRTAATSAVPEPPLRFAPPWALAAGAVALLVILVLGLVEAATRRGFRSDTPARASWSL